MKKIFLILTAIVIIVFINFCNLQSQIFINNNQDEIDSLFTIEYKNQIFDILNEKVTLLTLKNEFIKYRRNEMKVNYSLDTASVIDFHKEYIYECQRLLHSFINKDSIEILYKIRQQVTPVFIIDCEVKYNLLRSNNKFYMILLNINRKLIGQYINVHKFNLPFDVDEN